MAKPQASKTEVYHSCQVLKESLDFGVTFICATEDALLLVSAIFCGVAFLNAREGNAKQTNIRKQYSQSLSFLTKKRLTFLGLVFFSRKTNHKKKVKG